MVTRTTTLLAGALLSASAAILPIVSAPAAGADVCAGADGRHFAAGGCTNIAGDVVAGAAIAAVHTPTSRAKSLLHRRGRALLHASRRSC